MVIGHAMGNKVKGRGGVCTVCGRTIWLWSKTDKESNVYAAWRLCECVAPSNPQ